LEKKKEEIDIKKGGEEQHWKIPNFIESGYKIVACLRV
jgi:hypothetical protein